ncbi:MAG: hypothetical protein QM790_01860 [Nibricoccus sp.]
MKNLARFILACFAAQLLFVGIAQASITSSTEKAATCLTPGDDDNPPESF